MERSTHQQRILRDLGKKMVFLTGPRQSGKTWLCERLAQTVPGSLYLNYDVIEDRQIIKAQSWRAKTSLLVLDELHKMPDRKNYLKGVFDGRRRGLQILVTGSARLDTFRQSGDSLAGRFFRHRLTPFSLAELGGGDEALARLMMRGGFPEPYLAGTHQDADRWRLQYIDGLVRTDVLDFERVFDLRALQTTLELLRRQVGSLVSYSSIARDVGVSPNTVKRYLDIFDALFITFRIHPYSRNIARSLQHHPKVYFFDTGMVIGDEGSRFENLVGLSLMGHAFAQEDVHGKRLQLNFLRTKDGKEVDFVLSNEEGPETMIEAKTRDRSIHPGIKYFYERYQIPATQVVLEGVKEYQDANIEVRSASGFLSELSY